MSTTDATPARATPADDPIAVLVRSGKAPADIVAAVAADA
jgi:hypothetical protein